MANENEEDLIQDDTQEIEVVRQKRKSLELAVKKQQNLWGFSETGLEAKKAAMTMLSTRHGMYANIPIICKESECPYVKRCRLYIYDLAPLGEPCPVEVAEIERKLVAYTQDFDLDESTTVDNVIINELIETDIMMERCKKLISIRAMPLTTSVVDIIDGVEIKEEKVDQAIELNERLSKKRERLYNLMKATRKDQKDENLEGTSINDVIREILDRADHNEFIDTDAIQENVDFNEENEEGSGE